MSLGTVWTIDVILAAASGIAALALLIFYSRLAKERRSRFTLGLAAFSLIFFVQSLVAVVVYLRFASVYTTDVALPIMALHSMELVGIGAMLWMARQ